MSTVFLERKLVLEVVTGTDPHFGVVYGSLLFSCYINVAFTVLCFFHPEMQVLTRVEILECTNQLPLYLSSLFFFYE